MKKLVLPFIVAISLVFTVSCVSKEVPVTETYYETAMNTENYTDFVNGEEKLVSEAHWYCENLRISVQPAESENNNPWEYTPRTAPQSSSGVWYFGYKLPEHSSNKIIIQTWGKETESPWNPPPLQNLPLYLLEHGQQGGEMVSVYDTSNTGYWNKPPFDKPLYTTYIEIPSGSEINKLSNVSPNEIIQFNEWLGYFNTQLTNPALDTQYNKSEYQFDTTGIKTIAILIAGNQAKLSSNVTNSYIPESSHNNPIKSIMLVWSDNITRQQEVPYQAEKQRTVIQTKQVPFWEIFTH